MTIGGLLEMVIQQGFQEMWVMTRVETPGYQRKPVKTGSRVYFPNLL
jgi:hypothetical protein